MRSDLLRLMTALGGAGCALVGLVGGGITTAKDAGVTAAFREPATSTAPSQAAVDRQLRRLEQRHHGRVGAYAIDTGTGQILSHRAGEVFPTLSTFKAMVAAAVLRKAG